MDKPRTVEALEKFIEFEVRVLRRSQEQVSDDLNSVVDYLFTRFGEAKVKTRIGEKFARAVTDIAHEIVAAEVSDVLQPPKEH